MTTELLLNYAFAAWSTFSALLTLAILYWGGVVGNGPQIGGDE